VFLGQFFCVLMTSKSKIGIIEKTFFGEIFITF
jgi:hypothetical protein